MHWPRPAYAWRKELPPPSRPTFVWNIEVKHGLLYPTDEPGALGLLLAIDEDDERVAVVADPEWLRMLMKAIEDGADMGLLEIPEGVMLPIAATGWAEEWDDAGRAEMDHMLWLFRESGHDWARTRQAIDVLTGFRQ